MGGGVLLLNSFSYDQIRLHPEFHCPRRYGNALKVCAGGVVGQNNNHYHSSLSWVELRADQIHLIIIVMEYTKCAG